MPKKAKQDQTIKLKVREVETPVQTIRLKVHQSETPYSNGRKVIYAVPSVEEPKKSAIYELGLDAMYHDVWQRFGTAK